MITSIRRAALDRWLTRASELVDEQLASDAKANVAGRVDDRGSE